MSSCSLLVAKIYAASSLFCKSIIVLTSLLLVLPIFISIVNQQHQQEQSPIASLLRQDHSNNSINHNGDCYLSQQRQEHCSNDLDCNLNGICDKRKRQCICDTAWGGTNCSILRLLPTSIASGYRPTTRSSWGASVFYDDNDELYHMIAAEMDHGCGLTSWQSNSYTIHATSPTLDGPYTKNSTIVGLWSHNPTVARSTVDGSLLLMVAGYGTHNAPMSKRCVPSGCCVNGTSPCGMNPLHGCNSTTPPWPNPPPQDKRNPKGLYSNFSMYVSPSGSPYGPWYQKWLNVTAPNGDPMKTRQWTPAIWSLDNGTVVLLLVGGGLFYSSKPGWEGPYYPRESKTNNNLYWGCLPGAEDPFLYKDKRGNWHCVVHQGPYNDLVHAGGHTFSNDDGITWYTTPTSIYRGDFIDEIVNKDNKNNSFSNTSIQRTKIAKRERPHFVFDSQGNIIALTTGICVGDSFGMCNANAWPGYQDKTFTHVQRVATTREDALWFDNLYSTQSHEETQ